MRLGFHVSISGGFSYSVQRAFELGWHSVPTYCYIGNDTVGFPNGNELITFDSRVFFL